VLAAMFSYALIDFSGGVASAIPNSNNRALQIMGDIIAHFFDLSHQGEQSASD
jgi:hypothetical protein